MKRTLALLLVGAALAGCLTGCHFGETPGDPTPNASRAPTWSETFAPTEGKEMGAMQACLVNNEMVGHFETMAATVTYDDITYLKENITYLRKYTVHTREETLYLVKMEALSTALYDLYSGNCEAPACEAALVACLEAYGALPTDIRGILLPLNEEVVRAVIVNIGAFAAQQIQ